MNLPFAPSALLTVAINDLIAVRKDPNYIIAMGEWHMPVVASNKCMVCFAGAVMARTLDTPISVKTSPCRFGEPNESRLEALDSFRSGDWEDALLLMHIRSYDLSISLREDLDEVCGVGWVEYNFSPIKFIANVKKMAKIFKKHGY